MDCELLCFSESYPVIVYVWVSCHFFLTYFCMNYWHLTALLVLAWSESLPLASAKRQRNCFVPDCQIWASLKGWRNLLKGRYRIVTTPFFSVSHPLISPPPVTWVFKYFCYVLGIKDVAWQNVWTWEWEVEGSDPGSSKNLLNSVLSLRVVDLMCSPSVVTDPSAVGKMLPWQVPFSRNTSSLIA